MKYVFFVFIVVFVLTAIPVSAFELPNTERDRRDLRIELETIPAPAQQNFDKYVEELAVAAQSDERRVEQARKEQAAKAQKLKVLNPIVLFRW
ncbi:MAG TPA: hypothetical protein VNT76_16570 [Candidatus Binatus sp.]|nr:hypothetical protein [Candidatus Binatus sp.]